MGGAASRGGRSNATCWVLGCVAAAIGCTACGRFEFDPLRDAAGSSDVLVEGPCDLAAPFGTPVRIAELSDPVQPDGTLRLLPDELTGYFWSRRGAGMSQIYVVSRPDLASPFTLELVTGVAGGSNQVDPSISDDGSVMVLRQSGPGDDLYVATRVTVDSFAGTTAISSLNTPSTEAQCFLPLGRDEIYFQSTRTGAGDVYTATRTGTTFSAPTALMSIATQYDEGDPVVTPDGRTIYFRSDRPAAFGGYNIYTATRTDLGDTFGPATLVPNVNTSANDGPSWISPDGCRLYISSDAAGTNDVYVASRGQT